MSLQKRILKSKAAAALISWAMALYIRFIYYTTRWTCLNQDFLDHATNTHTPFIAAAWHGRFAMLAYSYDHPETVHLLISRHNDGEIIARIVEIFHFKTIRGSAAKAGKASKGGSAALRAMLSTIKDGGNIFITPDGPRGPRMRASDGIVTLARLSGAPIIPMAYSLSKRKVAGSWDRFIIPLPFGRGVFAYGDPIFVPRNADAEIQQQKLQEIEQALLEITNKADQEVGQDPIEPAPAREAKASS